MKRYIDTADESAILEARKESDWWESLGAAEKAFIKKGLREAEGGKRIPHNEVMKRYEGAGPNNLDS